MHIVPATLPLVLALLMGLTAIPATAKLPEPTPEQAQAAAEKKKQAAAQAEKEKEDLAKSMDNVAARWRKLASENGWETHAATPVATKPGDGASSQQAGPAGQPGGRLGGATAEAPVRSEKQGTAPPSPDVKNPAEKGK